MSKIKYSKKYKHVFSYDTVNGKQYGFRFPYYDNNEVRHEKQKRKFATEESAYKALLKIQLDIANNNIVSVSSSELTFEKWARQWLDSRKGLIKDSSYYSYDVKLRNQIYPRIGDQKLSELNLVTYQRLMINPLVRKGLLKKTIAAYHQVAMIVVNAAVDNDIITRNRLTKVKIPNVGKLDHRIMTGKELQAFNRVLRSAPLRFQALFMLLESTGMRSGEALGLRWEDIDFENQTISIKRTRDKFGARSPKTESSKRTITANTDLLHTLQKYHTQTIVDALKRGRGAIIKDDSYVVLSRLLNPMNATEMHRALKELLKSAGLNNLIGHFTAHTFRHMYGSYLLASGKNVVAVSRELGHENPAMTLKVYSHVIPGQKDNMSQDFLNIINS
ncbi:MAG: site-specific integrase [Lactobacillus sp.]|nr:MAG: site-specific integrase [Lactobacillus sp.]